MRSYNVPNDRALATSAGGVEYKQQVGRSLDLTGRGPVPAPVPDRDRDRYRCRYRYR